MNWVSSCCRETLGAGCKLFPRYSNEHFTYLPMKRNSDELKPRSIHYQSCITRHIFINRLDTRILSSARTRRNVKFNSVCLMYYVTFAIHPCGAKLQVFSSALVVAHLNPPARARAHAHLHPSRNGFSTWFRQVNFLDVDLWNAVRLRLCIQSLDSPLGCLLSCWCV